MERKIHSVILFALLFCLAAAVEDRYYPRYHLAPPQGWMDSPTGFCLIRDEYHLFYMYNPESSLQPGVSHWGHAKSKDLFTWEHLPIALSPDQSYDQSGVLSGSAYVEEGVLLYLFYTGNVNHPDKTPDHTQRQAVAYSYNGVVVHKYDRNPIIMGEEHQPNLRSPKVWKRGDTYYMILGNSFNNNTQGRVLLYTSEDQLQTWKQVSVLAESDGSLGHMWENPDLFELNGKWVLLFSPQGMKPDGDRYKNLRQTGYIVGDFNYDTYEFTPLTEFKELDYGHDLYATQTVEDNHGRRLLVAWLDMAGSKYPEQADGFTGQMSIPRELGLTDDYILTQNPVREISNITSNVLLSEQPSKDTAVALEDNTGVIVIDGKKDEDLEVVLESRGKLVTVSYNAKEGKVTLDRGGEDGTRRADWKPAGDFTWRMYVDASSIELFCGEGEVTFSSRFFPEGVVSVRMGANGRANHLTVTGLKRTIPSPVEDDGKLINWAEATA